MRTILFCAYIFLSTSSACMAGSQIDDAWTYLTDRGYADQWVVISNEGSKGYVQCERYEEYLRCPFPVWIKIIPGSKLYAPVEAQESPYPEIEGTITKQYLESSQVKKLTKVLAEENLEFAEVYSQLEDDKGAKIGTNHDVVLILELDYTKFEYLVEKILRRVWDVSNTGEYLIETDQ